MSKHTPGPWHAHETTIREQRYVIAEIANQGVRWPRSVGLANARLIAAAPRLLSALEAMVREVRKHHPQFDANVFVEGERAIKEATNGNA